MSSGQWDERLQVRCPLCRGIYTKRGLKNHQRGRVCKDGQTLLRLKSQGWIEVPFAGEEGRTAVVAFMAVWNILHNHKMIKHVLDPWQKKKIVLIKPWTLELTLALIDRGYEQGKDYSVDGKYIIDSTLLKDISPLQSKMQYLMEQGYDDEEVQSLLIERALTK